MALGGAISTLASPSWRDVVTQGVEMMHGIPVHDMMYRFSEEEYLREDTSLDEVFLRILSGPHTHLVVTAGEPTTGIIRLSDVFGLLWKEAKRLIG